MVFRWSFRPLVLFTKISLKIAIFTISNTLYDRYNEQTEMWEVSDIEIPNLRATTNAPAKSLVLGRHLWTIYNDSKQCNE